MKYSRKKTLIILLLLLSVIILTGCSKEQYYNISLYLDDSFNTINTVMIFTKEKKSDKVKEQLWEDVNNILKNLDKRFNIQDRGDDFVTELMEINNNAGIKPVVVSDETINVIKLAIEMSEKSIVDDVALFDITIAPVWDLWGFVNNLWDPLLGNYYPAPSQELVNEKLPLVNYKKIIINEDNKTIYLENQGMKIDLGAVIKGYAADKVREFLIEQGYTKAVIDIGRNIHTIGSHFDQEGLDKPWTVKLQTPFVEVYEAAEYQYFGKITVVDKTVVTSGTYEKYIMDEQGNMYHHILDPRTGFPFDNKVISITVVTTLSILGDCYSTTLFSLGLEKGMELVNSTEGLDAIWVVENNNSKEVYISSGLDGIFEFNQSVSSRGYVYKGVYQS